MQLAWPDFSDRFLATVVAGVAKRRGAIRRRGELRVWFPDATDTNEWCAISLEVSSRRAVMLSLWPRHHAGLRVVSTWRRDRGKVLLDLMDLRLPADADRIVAALEATVHLVACEPAAFEADTEALWRGLELRLV